MSHEVLDGLEVARWRHRETVCRGDRLHDHSGHVPAGERLLHRADIAERNLDEVVGLVGQKDLREPIVAGGQRQAGVTVVGLDDRDDLAALGGVTGALDRDVDGLAAAGPEGHVWMIDAGADSTSFCASAVRATDGK